MNGGFAVVDGVAVVAGVRRDVARAVGVVELPCRGVASCARAQHTMLERLLSVAEGVSAAVESGDGGVVGGFGDEARVVFDFVELRAPVVAAPDLDDVWDVCGVVLRVVEQAKLLVAEVDGGA